MTEPETFFVQPVGVVRSTLRSREDAPKQGFEGAPAAWLEIYPAFREALGGITPNVTFLVDSLQAFKLHLEQSGVEILSQPKDVPTGRNMRVRHPDGLVVEYVEHTSEM